MQPDSERPAQHPTFPIGGYGLEGLKSLRNPWVSYPVGSVIEQGIFLSADKEVVSIETTEAVITCDGRVFASIKHAGQVYTEAYQSAKPAGLDATLITADANLVRFPSVAEQVFRSNPAVYKWPGNRLIEPLLRPAGEIQIDDLTTGPFQGYSLVSVRTKGILNPWKATLYNKPTLAINPVASAIWLQSFLPEQVDKSGAAMLSKYVYGPALLISTAAIDPEVYEGLETAYDILGLNRREEAEEARLWRVHLASQE